MSEVLSAAKITSKGQITLSSDVRTALGVGVGDRVLFVQMDDGSIRLTNSSLSALSNVQAAFEGAANEAGLTSIEDVVRLVKSVRSERAGSTPCA